MSRYIAFLRAINVGGHNVKMDLLRSLFESMELNNVETFIASGNLIFETDIKSTNNLQMKIERQLTNALGYEVPAFLRTDIEINKIAKYAPFDESKMSTVMAYNIGFLNTLLTKKQQEKVFGFNNNIDDFHVNGKEIYWICKTKQSDSTFSANKLERAIRIPVTFRSIKTIQRLTAKYPPKW